MPYSTGCTTALSNFEAGQNYKDVSDPAVRRAADRVKKRAKRKREEENTYSRLLSLSITIYYSLSLSLYVCVTHSRFALVRR